jgi:hypothetical protein
VAACLLHRLEFEESKEAGGLSYTTDVTQRPQWGVALSHFFFCFQHRAHANSARRPADDASSPRSAVENMEAREHRTATKQERAHPSYRSSSGGEGKAEALLLVRRREMLRGRLESRSDGCRTLIRGFLGPRRTLSRGRVVAPAMNPTRTIYEVCAVVW